MAKMAPHFFFIVVTLLANQMIAQALPLCTQTRSASLPSYSVLDFDNDGISEIVGVKSTGSIVKFSWYSSRLSKVLTQRLVGQWPAVGDYDGDGIWDFATITNQEGKLKWTVVTSKNKSKNEFLLGDIGDTVLLGCRLVKNRNHTATIFREKERTISMLDIIDISNRSVELSIVGQGDPVGCMDTDGDGLDEIVFRVPGDTVNNDTLLTSSGRGIALSLQQVPVFRSSTIVRFPCGAPSSLALSHGLISPNNRLVQGVVLAANSFFPEIVVPLKVTIGSGVFKYQNIVRPALLWQPHSNGNIYSRFLGKNTSTRKIAKLKRGYTLVKVGGIIRTETRVR